MSAEGDESVPYLIQNPENPDQKVHELKFGLNTIGREINNTIILLHKSLSRHHAQLIINDEGVMMKDLGSMNKTFVNEREIDECQLRNGDLVRCGSV